VRRLKKISNDIIVALLGMAGTIIGSFIGVIASSKLTNFRLKQLEQKVDKHNNFAERIPVVEEKIKVLNHRVEDLENQNK
jgi:hypothetical protein